MLHVLDVPKGTRIVTMQNNSGTFRQAPSTVDTHYMMSYCIWCPIPTVGKPSVGWTDIDCGWLANTADHNGQKDVEHLDLNGWISPKRYFDSISELRPVGNLRSPVSWSYRTSTATRPGFTQTQYVTHIVPWMQADGSTNDMVGRLAGDNADYPFRFHVGVKWYTQRLVFSADTVEYVKNGKVYCNAINVTAFYFSNDWSYYAQLSTTYSHPAGMFSDWRSLLGAIEKNVHAWALSQSPSLPSSGLFATTKELAPIEEDQLKSFKLLGREEVFWGDLNPVWGDLAYDCYNQIQLWNSNGLAYGHDIALITRAAKDLVKVAKSLLVSKNVSGSLKSLSDLFLSFRYGWYLTAKDTLSLLQADYDRAYPMGRCKRSSLYTYYRGRNRIEARMSVYCRPYSESISELAGFLQMMDLDLTAENIWDLLPMSFVVDWIANVGSLLDRFDTLAQMDRFSIFLTGQTLKVTALVDAKDIPHLSSMSGAISALYYTRWYTTDVIPPSLASFRNSNQKFNHWLEGSALVLQRV